MAIYYFNASVVSRSAGRSATASAAYRAAERIKDERTGEIHDYRKKKGVDEKIILAPHNAPNWVSNRVLLWNEVERVERRKDAQLSREIKLAIPVELDRNQQIELVKEFANEQFVSKGMVADICFHELDSHNPHAHIMLTMREINEHGFSLKKNRNWNKREILEQQRAAWAKTANLALEKAGIDEAIDHRTLEAQGINRIPQIHLGSAVTAMMKRGIVTDKGEQYLAIESANKQLLTLEREITNLQLEKEQSHKDDTPQLTDRELVTAIRLVRAWQDSLPIKPNLKLAASLDKTVKQNQSKLNKLDILITHQQQELQRSQPRSLLHPWGMSKAEREARFDDLNRLKQKKDSINWDNRSTTQRLQSCQRIAKIYDAWQNRPERELANLIESDAYKSRVETLESGYQLYGAMISILNNRGIRSEESPQMRYFQGRIYRCEQRNQTISIFERDNPEPIYTATDNREAGGIIQIEQMKLEQQVREQMMEFARHLEVEQQRQQRKKQRGRGLSL